MKRLKHVLEASLPELTSLGGEGRNIDRDRLETLLRNLAAALDRAYWLRSGTAFLVLCVLVAVIRRYGDQPLLLGGAATGMAITFVGALAALKQVVDEMARVDMILSIAQELSLEALTEVARRIAAVL
jgi:hypothetical protein